MASHMLHDTKGMYASKRWLSINCMPYVIYIHSHGMFDWLNSLCPAVVNSVMRLIDMLSLTHIV